MPFTQVTETIEVKETESEKIKKETDIYKLKIENEKVKQQYQEEQNKTLSLENIIPIKIKAAEEDIKKSTIKAITTLLTIKKQKDEMNISSNSILQSLVYLEEDIKLREYNLLVNEQKQNKTINDNYKTIQETSRQLTKKINEVTELESTVNAKIKEVNITMFECRNNVGSVNVMSNILIEEAKKVLSYTKDTNSRNNIIAMIHQLQSFNRTYIPVLLEEK